MVLPFPPPFFFLSEFIASGCPTRGLSKSVTFPPSRPPQVLFPPSIVKLLPYINFKDFCDHFLRQTTYNLHVLCLSPLLRPMTSFWDCREGFVGIASAPSLKSSSHSGFSILMAIQLSFGVFLRLLCLYLINKRCVSSFPFPVVLLIFFDPPMIRQVPPPFFCTIGGIRREE